MAGPVSIFREIHRLRRFLRDLQEGIDRHPRLLKGQHLKVEAQEKQLKDNEDALKKLKIDVHQNELTLKTTSGQIQKYDKQMDSASSPKEMEAFKTQIANAKATVERLEDLMLGQLNEIDERTKQIPELKKLVDKAHDDYKTFETVQNEKQAERKVHMEEAQEQLLKLETLIPASVRGQYDRTVKSMGPDGFAGIHKNSCDACFGQITHQNILDLQQGLFVPCGACGRILYPPE